MAQSDSGHRFPDTEPFAAMVAHELKGQLVMLERLAAGLESAAASGSVEQLRSDSGRIQRIARDFVGTIEALRSLSSVDAAAQESVSLQKAATEAVELLKGSVDAQDVEIIIAANFPIASGSPILWRQVFRNLIENSIKACAGIDQPRVEIGCERGSSATTCFVRDNGCGPPNGDPTRLFDPQSECGLGLIIVRRVIERLGGRVWAECGTPGLTVRWIMDEFANHDAEDTANSTRGSRESSG